MNKKRMDLISKLGSFIMLESKTMNDVFALGTDIIKLRNEDRYYDDTELVKLSYARELGIPPNTPISFPTGSIDTYVTKIGRFGRWSSSLCAETFGDIDWMDVYGNTEYVLLAENYPEYMPSKIHTYYWWLNYGVVGRHISNEEWTEFATELDLEENNRYYPRCWKSRDHFSNVVKTITGEIICLDCYKENGGVDMIIKPATILKKRPRYIVKPNMKLRG